MMQEAKIGIIGGTGLGDALLSHITDTETVSLETPFGKPSGPLITGLLGDREIVFLNRHGKNHRFNPSCVPYPANIFAMKKLGVRTLITSGAVGSLREHIEPGNLVIVDQFIDKTYRRQSSFFDELGAVHCEFDQPCCARLPRAILRVAEVTSAMTHDTGTYVCMEGPEFSTRAESLLHRQWGADLIGMTALPEAKLAREAQMCYAMIALVSDFDCWKEHPKGRDKHDLLKEILSNLNQATSNAIELITAVLQGRVPLLEEECSCRKSLELAVWTHPKSINVVKRKKLGVLFT
jgi:5'-methylthioadenosine phosphorylase